MVRLLLDHGADPAACDTAGANVLDFARKSGKADIVAMVESALVSKR